MLKTLETILLSAMTKNPRVANASGAYMVDLGETNRFYLANDLSYLLDIRSGKKYLMTAEDPTRRALASGIPGLGNVTPLSAVYLAGIALNKPDLPDSVLLNSAIAPELSIRHYDASVRLTIDYMSTTGTTWLVKNPGYQSSAHPGYYHIIGFGDYLISQTGVLIRSANSDVIERDLKDSTVYNIYDNFGEKVYVKAATLMQLAFGLYDNTLSSELYYADGNESNVALTNLTTVNSEDDSYSIELQEGDEDGVNNY